MSESSSSARLVSHEIAGDTLAAWPGFPESTWPVVSGDEISPFTNRSRQPRQQFLPLAATLSEDGLGLVGVDPVFPTGEAATFEPFSVFRHYRGSCTGSGRV